nr:peptidoglycan-binding domain-containing protein [Marinomonas ostreistagni]
MRQAVCNNDLNSGLVAQLQQRLKESGYEAGPADGRLGQKTMEALGAFQGDNGLAVGSITFEALNALGINPNN